MSSTVIASKSATLSIKSTQISTKKLSVGSKKVLAKISNKGTQNTTPTTTSTPPSTTPAPVGLVNAAKLNTLQTITCSSIAGMVGVSSGYPLDTVRVRMQSRNGKMYTSGLDCFLKIIKNEGPLSLYKGVTTPIAGQCIMKGVSFGINHAVSKSLGIDRSKDFTTFSAASVGKILVSGSVTGFTSSIISTPFETIKVRLQVQKKNKYKGPIDCASKLFQKRGFKNGLYRGYATTALRDSAYFCAYFPTYEIVKSLMHKAINYTGLNEMKKTNETGLSSKFSLPFFLECGVAGGFAGMAAWTASLPLDYIKTRLQSDTYPPKYNGLGDCMKKTFNKGGVSAFYTGLRTTLFRAFPVHCIFFCTFETVRQTFLAHEEQKVYDMHNPSTEDSNYKFFFSNTDEENEQQFFEKD